MTQDEVDNEALCRKAQAHWESVSIPNMRVFGQLVESCTTSVYLKYLLDRTDEEVGAGNLDLDFDLLLEIVTNKKDELNEI